jgi:hypothetical protein
VSTTPNDPNSGGYGDSSGGYGGGYGGAPSYGSAPAAGSGSNPMAIVALVLGILSILTACFWFVAAPLGIAAIVLGFLGRGKAKRGQARQGGLALAGIITGAIGLLLTIGLTIAGISLLSQFEDCSDPSLTQDEQAQCVQEQLEN